MPADSHALTEEAVMAVDHRPRTPAPRPAPPARGGAPAPARPRRAAAVLIPVALTLALGLWGLRRQGTLWRDEAVTYDMARRDPAGLLRVLDDYDIVHGLYYLLMQGVFAVCGDGLVPLRLPSVLAMAAAAAGVAVLGRMLAGPGTGLAAGAVFALLPDVQRYAQEGRSYALVCAAVVWATVLFVRAVDERRTGLWAGYAALSLAACLLHEFAFLAVLAHGVTVLAARAPAGQLRAWGAAAGGVAACLAPPAAISAGQTEQVAWIGPPDVRTSLGIVALAAVALACAAAVGGRVAAVALPLALVPTAALLLASPVTFLFVDRYVVYSGAGVALLTGAALHAGWRRGGPPRVAVAAVAAVSAAALAVPVGQHLRSPESRPDDLAAVAAAVQARSAPGDGLLFSPARRRAWTLSGDPAYRGLTDLALRADPRASHTLYGTELPPAAIRARMLGARRIVVLHDPAGQPLDGSPAERVKRATLRTGFERCATTRVHGARVTLYARPGAC
ncbi:glycosyltransferase family 39 protein [Streptomyces sp. MAR4 CNX-425]|uniref:glycosyltransferase family 39 protein n=1 Tax=Streptomyces sp. MAR4 CNX-425 TaxID=3406343 RepID=UPI003B505716